MSVIYSLFTAFDAVGTPKVIASLLDETWRVSERQLDAVHDQTAARSRASSGHSPPAAWSCSVIRVDRGEEHVCMPDRERNGPPPRRRIPDVRQLRVPAERVNPAQGLAHPAQAPPPSLARWAVRRSPPPSGARNRRMEHSFFNAALRHQSKIRGQSQDWASVNPNCTRRCWGSQRCRHVSCCPPICPMSRQA
jgi:hypothetical protein